MMLRCITMIIMLKELTSWYLVKLYGFTSLYDLWFVSCGDYELTRITPLVRS